ncbi:MAG: cation:proton antiporter family protein [Myxococcota bacterium]
MELQWIGAAFLCGVIARALRQPPLLGFLFAGFGLELYGLRPDASLRELAHIGILLLLFAIGIKLDFRLLTTRYVAGSALVHMALSTLVAVAPLWMLAQVGLALAADLELAEIVTLGFALSFSSTVFAVKVLEGRDDINAFYGEVAVGILIAQDIAAVLFIVFSEGAWPSPLALGLPLLWLTRPLIAQALRFCGHGELLILAGLAAALGGAALFDAVGLKSDFGALAAGVLCAGHNKSKELSASLLSLKEVFLVGFFLTIGLTGLPTLETLVIGVLLLILLPVKNLGFLLLLTGFRLRSRTALLASSSLTTFSEFGLIVVAAATTKGVLDEQWLIAIAIAVGLSFFVGSTINGFAFELLRRARSSLNRLQREPPVDEERAVDVGNAKVLVFGMGRVGTPAFDTLRERFGDRVVGFDVDKERIQAHRAAGRRVYVASATDAEIWQRLHVDQEKVEAVLLAMSSHEEHRVAIRQLRLEGYEGVIAATARFDDEIDALKKAGATTVFHVLKDVGPAFVARAMRGIELQATGNPPAERTAC